MKIEFAHDGKIHWSAWPSTSALLSFDHLSYSIQAGDQLFWQLGSPDPDRPEPRARTLDAWIASTTGSIWHFLHLPLSEGAASAAHERLGGALEQLARTAAIAPPSPGQAPPHPRLVGTVIEQGIARGKTMATWNGIPSQSPFVTLDVAGLGQAVQLCPGWGPEACLVGTLEPSRRRALEATLSTLQAAEGQPVSVTGRWSKLRVVPPDLPDAPRQRPIARISTPRMLDLTAIDALITSLESAEAPAASVTPAIEAPRPEPEPVWAPVDPRVFFWCFSAETLR